MAREGVLEVVEVEVVRQAGDQVQVRGLAEGEAVILTRLDLAAPSMAVRVESTVEAGQ